MQLLHERFLPHIKDEHEAEKEILKIFDKCLASDAGGAHVIEVFHVVGAMFK